MDNNDGSEGHIGRGYCMFMGCETSNSDTRLPSGRIFPSVARILSALFLLGSVLACGGSEPTEQDASSQDSPWEGVSPPGTPGGGSLGGSPNSPGDEPAVTPVVVGDEPVEAVEDAVGSDADAAGCVPDCQDKACGDDGCGGQCGSCVPEEICVTGGKCELPEPCEPDCTSKQCGDDGCGGSCGVCQQGDCDPATGLCVLEVDPTPPDIPCEGGPQCLPPPVGTPDVSVAVSTSGTPPLNGGVVQAMSYRLKSVTLYPDSLLVDAPFGVMMAAVSEGQSYGSLVFSQTELSLHIALALKVHFPQLETTALVNVEGGGAGCYIASGSLIYAAPEGCASSGQSPIYVAPQFGFDSTGEQFKLVLQWDADAFYAVLPDGVKASMGVVFTQPMTLLAAFEPLP